MRDLASLPENNDDIGEGFDHVAGTA